MPQYKEVKIKPPITRRYATYLGDSLDLIQQDTIAVAPEYAKVGLKIDVEGTTTTVVEVITNAML